MVELKTNRGTLYVPFHDYVETNEPLWYVGFQKVEIEIINDNHYHIGYDEETPSGWGDIYAELYIKNGKIRIKGKGSRNFRENIIRYYNWFQKAKNDERYIEMFHPLWFD